MVVKDRLLAALAAEERRFVCRYLLSRNDSILLDELTAALVAGAERPRGESSIDESRFDCAAVDLHHHHLPKLDEANLVEYDTERSLVEPGAALPHAELVFDALDEIDAPQSRV